MWPLTRRYLAAAGGLAAPEVVLGVLLARGAASGLVAAAMAFAFWTVIPLVLLGRTALWAYDLVAHARGARQDSARRHVT